MLQAQALRHPRLSRWAITQGDAPALDVDLDLLRDRTGRQAAGRRRRARRNPDAATETYAVGLELTLSHEAGDLDHRAFVSFDVRHHFLRPVHAQMHAFRNVDAARLIGGAAAGGEDITLGTSWNRDAYGIFRHGFLFLCSQRSGRHGE